MSRLTVRIDFDEQRAIGPGKIKLLELIDRHGSISEAGRQMGMSYRRAWLLVDNLNRCFRAPVVTSQAGGQHGGGASLTEFGYAVVEHYRASKAPPIPPAPLISKRWRRRWPIIRMCRRDRAAAEPAVRRPAPAEVASRVAAGGAGQRKPGV